MSLFIRNLNECLVIYLPCEGLDAQIPTDIHVTVKRKGTLVNSMIIPIVNTRRNGV